MSNRQDERAANKRSYNQGHSEGLKEGFRQAIFAVESAYLLTGVGDQQLDPESLRQQIIDQLKVRAGFLK